MTLCAVTQLAGADWGADNTIVYGQYPGDIMRISANGGGTPESVVKQKPGSLALVISQILPDGKSLLYTDYASSSQMRIMVKPPKSGEPKELFVGAGAAYLPTGHLIYMLPNNNLFAIPFDLDRLEVKGGAVPVVEGVSKVAISNAGTLVYTPPRPISSAARPKRTLVWVNRQGKEEPISAVSR